MKHILIASICLILFSQISQASDLNKLNADIVCDKSVDSEGYWTTDKDLLDFVKAAKARGLDCGAKKRSNEQLKSLAENKEFDPSVFAKKIYQAFFDKNFDQILSLYSVNFLIGPPEKYIRSAGKTFEEVYGKSTIKDVLNSKGEIEFDRWRSHYKLKGTGVYFRNLENGDIGIYRISHALPEVDLPSANGSLWPSNNGLLKPQCFSDLWPSYDNYEIFSDFFKIKDDLAYFAKNIGKYFGKEIYNFEPLKTASGEKVSLARKTNYCTKTEKYYESSPTNFIKVASIPSSHCDRMAPNMSSKCKSAFLVKLDLGEGHRMGRYPLAAFGLFASRDEEMVIPLVNFSDMFDAVMYFNQQ